MTALLVLVGAVVALLAVLVAGLLRSHADILRSLHQLEIGEQAATTPATATTAADLVGVVPTGGQRAVTVGGIPHATLLAFLSAGCATCAEFWSAFAEPDTLDLPGEGTRLVIVTKGPEAESPGQIGGLAPRDVVTLMATEAWDRYQVPGSPYFVLLDGPTGQVVGEGSGTSWTQVAGLLRSAVADVGWAGGRTAGATNAKPDQTVA